MGYDDRRGTLDPGLTALALRARQNPRGRYPFLEHARGRNLWLIASGVVAGAFAAWRHRRARRASSTGQPPPARPPASPPVS